MLISITLPDNHDSHDDASIIYLYLFIITPTVLCERAIGVIAFPRLGYNTPLYIPSSTAAHKHAYKHTYIHTYTHIHTHTYIYIYI